MCAREGNIVNSFAHLLCHGDHNLWFSLVLNIYDKGNIVNSFLFLTFVISRRGLREAFVVWPGLEEENESNVGFHRLRLRNHQFATTKI